MKKKLLILALLAAFAASLFGCGAGQKELPEPVPQDPVQEEPVPENTPEAPAHNWTEDYREVLDDFYEFIFEADSDEEELYGSIGVSEVLHLNERIDTLKRVGYAFEDLTGDGIPELLIGAIDPDSSERRGSEIYCACSCTDGTPRGLLQGWARSSYQLMDDGSFFYRGSGGAMYGGFGKFTLNEDASELVCDDFYFFEPDGETYDGFVFYHNTSGIWDMSVSDVMELDDDAFWALADGMEDHVSSVVFTPFAEYFDEEVRIQPADEVVSGTVPAKTVTLSDAAPQMQLVLFAEDRVTDLRILAQNPKELDANGFPQYTSELYRQDELTADDPLAVTLCFIGDIPNYAISYVDSEGETELFAIAESGMDGLIFLMEL